MAYGRHSSDSSSPYAIELKGLTRKFGSFTAVDNLSLQVRKGELFGFLGPNGAGKTTTINMLTTLLKPTEGNALVAGFDLNEEDALVRSRIGVVPQSFSLLKSSRRWKICGISASYIPWTAKL